MVRIKDLEASTEVLRQQLAAAAQQAEERGQQAR